MSLAGLKTFEQNLRKLMACSAFKKADEAQKLNMGQRLINSKFGGTMGFKIEELPPPLLNEQFDARVREAIQRRLDETESLVARFIAETGCKPSECEIVIEQDLQRAYSKVISVRRKRNLGD